MAEESGIFFDPVLPPIDFRFEEGKNLSIEDVEGKPPVKRSKANEELLRRAAGGRYG